MAVARKEMEFEEDEQARVCAVEGCGRQHAAKGYCKSHYYTLRRVGDPKKLEPYKVYHNIHEYFLDNINKGSNDDECWIWKVRFTAWGYGRINWNKKEVRAHRYSYEYYNGKIPDNLFICHTCHTPACVNPKHLYAGTPKENTRDALIAERMSSTLSRNDVIEIKKRLEKNESLTALGKEFGVQKGCIWNIKHNRSWRHVT